MKDERREMENKPAHSYASHATRRVIERKGAVDAIFFGDVKDDLEVEGDAQETVVGDDRGLGVASCSTARWRSDHGSDQTRSWTG